MELAGSVTGERISTVHWLSTKVKPAILDHLNKLSTAIVYKKETSSPKGNDRSPESQ